MTLLRALTIGISTLLSTVVLPKLDVSAAGTMYSFEGSTYGTNQGNSNMAMSGDRAERAAAHSNIRRYQTLSLYGKTEGWYFWGSNKDAHIYLGLKKGGGS